MPATTTSRRARRPQAPALRFDQRLVLNQWILSLFEEDSFIPLTEGLQDAALEGVDENNVSRFHHVIAARLFERQELTRDVLLQYDENIVRHTQAISTRRKEPLRWKYFQYLGLLFAEIYLDRYFRDPGQLLADLNAHLAAFNTGKAERDQIKPYAADDLHKLAFWSATGSGKTLLMHVKILQYRHYLKLHGRERQLNRTILLTPNEGLSRQHLEEFEASGIEAEIFSKDGRGLFAGHSVEILEVTKLQEESGDQTVAVDAFESNNLVLVDEGHRGAGGFKWKSNRDRLCENGFTFEYSATFSQALKAANKPELTEEYARCVLFDYSYKYFYRDGFGKDYSILNLADDRDAEVRRLYLTACLLAFYQQLVLFEEDQPDFRPFLLERPLWILVGSKVTAVRTEGRREVSDVVDVLLFLAEFIQGGHDSVARIQRLLSGNTGLLNTHGNDIFSRAFPFLVECGLAPAEVFADILKNVFNAATVAALHVDHLKGSDGEIALRIGENEPFGVINVGDAPKLCDLCDQHPDLLKVAERPFSTSLFAGLNDTDSRINLLVGSKKFTEGWISWRVSTMGLLNVGQTEGAQIIQLFGRGVRLKGYNFGLKRSGFVEEARRNKPAHINLLETLNVFGVRAQFMQQFKEYLEEEGLPPNDDRIEFLLPTFKSLGSQKLKILRLPDDMDFKRNGPKPVLGPPDADLHGRRIALDWYPKIQSRIAPGLTATADIAPRNQANFTAEHLAFFDWREVDRQLEEFKNERAWFNLNLPTDACRALLQDPGWYTLYIPPQEMEIGRFDRVYRWQEIAVALLKKYCDAFFKTKKAAWEAPRLRYEILDENDENFVPEYRFLIDESAKEIIIKLSEVKEAVASRQLKQIEWGTFRSICFGPHLYQPLIYLNSTAVDVRPVVLNEGERDFVLDLKKFYERDPPFFEGKELYLLRNLSRGRGIGFFEAGNFYPDFILWLLAADKQHVSFVDPKGIRNLDGADDPKISFYQTIKTLERRLADPKVILNSFIIASTPYHQVSHWRDESGKRMAKTDFEARHVLFQNEDKSTYIARLLNTAMTEADVWSLPPEPRAPLPQPYQYVVTVMVELLLLSGGELAWRVLRTSTDLLSDRRRLAKLAAPHVGKVARDWLALNGDSFDAAHRWDQLSGLCYAGRMRVVRRNGELVIELISQQGHVTFSHVRFDARLALVVAKALPLQSATAQATFEDTQVASLVTA